MNILLSEGDFVSDINIDFPTDVSTKVLFLAPNGWR
jgi:hypothetical protein